MFRISEAKKLQKFMSKEDSAQASTEAICDNIGKEEKKWRYVKGREWSRTWNLHTGIKIRDSKEFLPNVADTLHGGLMSHSEEKKFRAKTGVETSSWTSWVGWLPAWEASKLPLSDKRSVGVERAGICLPDSGTCPHLTLNPLWLPIPHQRTHTPTSCYLCGN